MKQHLRQLVEQLGWQGISGAILLVLAGMFNLLALQPLQQDASVLSSQLEREVRSSNPFSHGARQIELGEFFESLPSESDVTDILASIASIAETSKVEIRQAEYHLDDRNQQRLEYGMFFPIQGDYANIRTFVFHVLSDQPAIALDQINFQRDKVNDSILKAEIKFTLFLHPKMQGKQ